MAIPVPVPVTAVADEEVKGAGSVIEVSFDDGTTLLPLVGVENIPQIGEEGSFLEVTGIHEFVRRYTSGIKTPSQFELPFRDVASDTTQQSLIDAADAGDKVQLVVTYSNGRVATFDCVMSGHYAAEVGLESILMHAVKGQIDGSIVWTKVA